MIPNLETLLAIRPKAKKWNGELVIWSEHKLDGFRLTIIKREGIIQAIGRKMRIDYADKIRSHLPETWRALCNLADNTVLDGELVGGDTSSDVIGAIYSGRASYSVFAIPYLAGKREVLSPESLQIILRDSGLEAPVIGPSPYSTTEEELLQYCKDKGIEGLMLKTSPWNGWYKLKPIDTLDAICIGWKRHVHSPDKLGALTLGMVADCHGPTGEALRARSPGMTQGSKALLGRAQRASQGTGGAPWGPVGGVSWAIPGQGDLPLVPLGDVGTGFADEMRKWGEKDCVNRVCEIAYQGLGNNGKLRFPRFIRWRDDKPATECLVSEIIK